MYLRHRNRFCLLLLLISIIGCEDVIEIELPTEEPRLIIDALIPVDTTQSETLVSIKVSLTDGFFGSIPLTKLDNIIIETAKELENGLTEIGFITFPDIASNFGTYETRVPTQFLIEEGIFYTLFVEHEGRLYAGQTYYDPAPKIDSIVQGSATDTFLDDDKIELIVSITDIAGEDNFYVFNYGSGEYSTTEDQFYKDQSYSFSYFLERNIEPNTPLEVRILGADRRFYNYMNLLIEQSEGVLDIFQTPFATVRGNVFDIEDLDNIDVKDNVEQPNVFPLGYFAIIQENKATITIQ